MPDLAHSPSQVMLVEDSLDDEALTVRALRSLSLGITVDVFRDGQQASEFIAGLESESPLLIILDLKVPKLNGLEILKILRQNLSTSLTPVVMLTSSDEPRDLLHSYRAGANGYVKKPVDYDEYVKAVKELGSFWLSLNVPPPRAV